VTCNFFDSTGEYFKNSAAGSGGRRPELQGFARKIWIKPAGARPAGWRNET
jgi:hypothetical protein